MNRKIRVFGLVLALLIVPFLTLYTVAASGDFYSMQVIFENREFEIGEQVNFTVMVWWNDQLTTVDDVTGFVLNLTTWPPSISELVIFNETAQQGIYEGNFTIKEEHVGFFNGTGGFPIAGKLVFFLVQATVGSDPVAESMTFLYIDQAPNFILEVSNPEPVPGEIVSLDLTIWNGSYVDADIVNITVYNSTTIPPDLSDPANMPPGELLPVTSNGTGRYNALYSIPSTLQNATYYSILVNATFNDEYINYEPWSNRFFPKVFIVNMFQVYTHLVYEETTQIIFDLYVTDLTGSIISGANLDIILFYDNGSFEKLSNISDGLGKAGFDIALDPAALSVYVTGWANYTGKSQFFSSEVIDRKPVGPDTNEFTVIFIEEEGIPALYRKGETVFWNYTAYNNSLPLPYQEIYYWIWNYSGDIFTPNLQFIENGNITTDSNGNFTLILTIPENLERLAIDFKTNVSGEVLEYEDDTFFRILDEDLIITYDTLDFGNAVNITVQVEASNDTVAFIMVAPLVGGNQDLNWSMPLSMSPEGFPSSTMMRRDSSGQYHRRVNLPVFWPTTSDYMIFVAILDRFNFEVHANYTIIELSPPHVVSFEPVEMMDSRLGPMVVEFDEEINVTASTDPVQITSIGTVPSFTISWSNENKTMTITFDDRIDYETQYTVTINSTGLLDMGGLALDGNNNDLIEGSPNDDFVFSFTSPYLPRTSDDYDGLWHTTDFTITLTATGGDEGINETYYIINSGPVFSVSMDGMPQIINEDANNTLEYWSTDISGTEETPHNILWEIKLDKTPPTTSDDYDGLWHGSDIMINLNASDPISGISDIYYSINAQPTQTVSMDGMPNIITEGASNMLEYWSIDNATNEETPHNILTDIKLDKSPPSTFHDYDGKWHTQDIVINLTTSDLVSGINETYYRINSGPIMTLSENGTPIITTQDKNNTLEYWSLDNASIEELPHNMLYEIKLDKTKPSTADNYDGLLHNADIVVTLFAFDAISGLNDTYYRINGGSIMSVLSNGQPVISTEGMNNTLEYWSVDNATNEEDHHFVYNIMLDKTAPEIIYNFPTGNSISLSANIMINWSEPVVESSVENAFNINPSVGGNFIWDGWNLTFDPFTNLIESTEYTITINTTARDFAGNHLTFDFVWQFNTTFSQIHTSHDYGGEWRSSDITITLTASGGQGGVLDTYYRINDGPTKSVSTDGMPVFTTEGSENKLEYWSVDNALNEESHHTLLNIKLDKTPPVSSDDYDGEWHNIDITIILTASDELNGIGNIYYQINDGLTKTVSSDGPPVIANEGPSNKLEYWSEDTLGNEEIHNVLTEIKLDKTKPITSYEYEHKWYNSDVTVILDAEDTVSGVKDIYYKINDGEVKAVSLDGQPKVTTEGTSNKIEFWNEDNASNGANHQTITGIRLDKTKPSVMITSEEEIVSGDYLFEVTIMDDNLDTSSIKYQIDSEEPQSLPFISDDNYGITIDTTNLTDDTYTLRVIAYDNAGNANNTQSIEITVDNTPPTTPTISNLPSKTKDESITISGTAEAGSEIEVFLNGISVGTTMADENGAWTMEITLIEGENKVSVESRDPAGNSAESSDYFITHSTETGEEEGDNIIWILIIVVIIIIVIIVVMLIKKRPAKELPEEVIDEEIIEPEEEEIIEDVEVEEPEEEIEKEITEEEFEEKFEKYEIEENLDEEPRDETLEEGLDKDEE